MGPLRRGRYVEGVFFLHKSCFEVGLGLIGWLAAMAKHMEAVRDFFDIPEQESSNITCACKHCGEELKSTITRLHAHVAGVKGGGI